MYIPVLKISKKGHPHLEYITLDELYFLLSFIGVLITTSIIHTLWTHGKFEGKIKSICANKKHSAKKRMNQLTVLMGEKGYYIQYRDDEQLQLVQKKTFSFLTALIFTLTFVLPLILYIFYFLSKTDRVRTFTFKPAKTIKKDTADSEE